MTEFVTAAFLAFLWLTMHTVTPHLRVRGRIKDGAYITTPLNAVVEAAGHFASQSCMLHFLRACVCIFFLFEVHFFRERRDSAKAIETYRINGVVVIYSVNEIWMEDQVSDRHRHLMHFCLLSPWGLAG